MGRLGLKQSPIPRRTSSFRSARYPDRASVVMTVTRVVSVSFQQLLRVLPAMNRWRKEDGPPIITYRRFESISNNNQLPAVCSMSLHPPACGERSSGDHTGIGVPWASEKILKRISSCPTRKDGNDAG